MPRRTAIWPKRPSARFWDASFLSSAMVDQQPRDGFRVANLSRAHELERRVEAHAHRLEDLVGIAPGRGGGEVPGDVDVHELGAEPGGRVEFGDLRPAAGLEAGLFDDFALRGRQRRLALLDGPGGDLVDLLPDAGTELPEQDDVAVGMDGNDRHGAGVFYDAERRAAAVREDQVAVDEPNDASPEDFFLGLDPEFHAAVNCSPNRRDYKHQA